MNPDSIIYYLCSLDLLCLSSLILREERDRVCEGNTVWCCCCKGLAKKFSEGRYFCSVYCCIARWVPIANKRSLNE